MVPKLEKKSDCLFLISSAIHAKHGIYNTEERLVQTLRTCRSIKNKVPDCAVYVLDGGYKNISDDEGNELEKYIDKFYNFSQNQNVINIQKLNSHDIVKNLIELYMYSTFLNDYDKQISENHRRVFKISGRYRLNDNFNFENHLQAINKIIILGPLKSQFSSQITGGVTSQYMSRLWSFDAALTTYIKECYNVMVNDMLERVNNEGYIDIEHLLYKRLDPTLIQNVKQIGIEGALAPNGAVIEE